MKKILLIVSIALLGACNYLEIDPIGQVVPSSTSDYRAMLTKAYEGYPKHKQRLMWPSDEVDGLGKDHGEEKTAIYNLTWRAETRLAEENTYLTFYTTLFYVNEVIDKIIGADSDGSGESKQQILAEAHAVRAYCYFDLLNMYAKWYDPTTATTDAGVPLTTIVDIQQEFPRSSVAEGYELILSDLQIARDNMEVDFQEQAYKYRFSKLSLTALESRIRLYMSEWDSALELAKQAIIAAEESGASLVDLVTNPDEKPFAATSTESILTLELPFQMTIYALDATYLSDDIVALYVDGDARLEAYINKTELMTPDYMAYRWVSRCSKEKERVSIRLSELYLNAAEGAIKKANPSVDEAITYLGALQEKRFTSESQPDLSSMTVEQLTTEIANERARELIMEGHRWFDIRRTTRGAMTKNILTEWYINHDTFEEVKVYEDYTINANDPRYILPFPRSAKEQNKYLN